MANHLDDRLTHAGGVVYRGHGATLEFLVITARRNPREWVLPKGHIEAGEMPETAAAREVAEETGVIASVERALGDTTVQVGDEHQRIRFYLMRAAREGEPDEARSMAWLRGEPAIARLTFADTRALLRNAVDLLAERDPS